MLKLIVMLLFALVVGIALTFYYFGVWMGILSIAVAFVILGKLVPAMIGAGIKRFAMKMFESKSIVLRGATVVVHGVTPGEAPRYDPEDIDDEEGDEGEEGDEDESPARYVDIDVTITPKPQADCPTPFAMWDPYDLTIVPSDTPTISLKNLEDLEAANEDVSGSGNVEQVRQLTHDGSPMPEGPARDVIDGDENEDAYDEDEGVGKISGEMRVMLTMSVPEAASGRYKFRYYFEDFGEFTLPA